MTTERPCPDAARLQLHLQGTLAQPDESEFIAHLNTCEICQRSLETMAADGDWLLSAAARSGREPASIDSRLSAVLDALNNTTVFDDFSADRLIGGSGLDGFLSAALDQLVDVEEEEQGLGVVLRPRRR